MTIVWICAAGLFMAAMIGTAIGFTFRELPHKWNDTVLGYCAGVMLGASTLGLIVPAFEGCADGQWWIVAAGVMAGALALNVLDLLTPHMHHITGLDPETHRHNRTLGRVMLFVMAIALHKLPEGIAAGVGLTGGGTPATWAASFGIALQNVPEAMVIIAPLLLAGISRKRTAAISVAIATLEVGGVWAGYALGTISEAMLPIMLGFAGGAMLYVTSDEMIPETHAHGFQKQATYALLAGYITIVMIEKMYA